jgi:FtsP/CotA-like multicopper oxidase with cupredoxin domain
MIHSVSMQLHRATTSVLLALIASFTTLCNAADVEFTLRAYVDSVAIKPGALTEVWRYGGTLVTGNSNTVANLASSSIGPIIRVQQGDTLVVHFQNDLPEATNVHWHGLDIPAAQDGYATDLVAAGASRDITFTVLNPAGTYWFHPHPDMTTAHQVMKGLAGMIIVEDAAERALDLPSGALEIPMVLQDRSFTAKNQLIYAPSMTEMMIGWVGNTMMINGYIDTSFDVPTRVHRLRLLNGCNSRSFKLAWNDATPMMVIGNDGGLLSAPRSGGYLMLGPGERADVWADFSTLAVGSTRTLLSQAFHPGQSQGAIPNGAALTVATFSATSAQTETRTLPTSLVAIEQYLLKDAANPTTPRAWPIGFSNNEFTLNGGVFVDHGVAANEIVPCDTLEYIEITNIATTLRMAHPFHLHGRSLQVIERTNLSGNATAYANVVAGFNDSGWKDTFLIWPGERVRFLVRWSAFAGDYVYHCHLLEHEEMGMMRTVRIEPCPLLGDLNNDGAVNDADLALLLGGWGTAAGDVNADGSTDASDLSMLLGNWGA